MEITKSLWNLSPNQQATVSGFKQALSKSLCTRLIEMGISTNQSIICLRNSPISGPKTFQIGDSVFCLEKELADNILLK